MAAPRRVRLCAQRGLRGPRRDSDALAPDDVMTETRGTVSTAEDPAAAQDATAAPGPKLADPPIPGGRVEAMMGMLIRVLAHSPLARPLPAVSLSALGLGLV